MSWTRFKVYLGDSDANQYFIDIVDAQEHLELNDAGYLEFTVLPTDSLYDDLQLFKKVRADSRDYYVKSIDVDMYKRKHVYAEGVLGLLNNTLVTPRDMTGSTLKQYLDYIVSFNTSSITVRNVTVINDDDRFGLNIQGYDSIYSIIKKMVSSLGGYLTTEKNGTGWYIDYLADPTTTATQIIELGVNLLDYKMEQDGASFYNYVIAEGAEGLIATAQNATSISANGRIEKYVSFPNTDTYSSLQDKALAVLNLATIDPLIEVSALDMSVLSDDVTPWKLGDKVRVVSAVHGIDAEYPITSMIINMSDPSQSKYVLNRDKSRFTKTVADDVRRAVEEAVEEIIEPEKARAYFG